jgi:hypothetical protein
VKAGVVDARAVEASGGVETDGVGKRVDVREHGGGGGGDYERPRLLPSKSGP